MCFYSLGCFFLYERFELRSIVNDKEDGNNKCDLMMPVTNRHTRFKIDLIDVTALPGARHNRADPI